MNSPARKNALVPLHNDSNNHTINLNKYNTPTNKMMFLVMGHSAKCCHSHSILDPPRLLTCDLDLFTLYAICSLAPPASALPLCKKRVYDRLVIGLQVYLYVLHQSIIERGAVPDYMDSWVEGVWLQQRCSLHIASKLLMKVKVLVNAENTKSCCKWIMWLHGIGGSRRHCQGGPRGGKKF